jgi:hypothetical protein
MWSKFGSAGADRRPEQAEMGVQCSPFRTQKEISVSTFFQPTPASKCPRWASGLQVSQHETLTGRKGAMNSKHLFLVILALAISFSTTEVAAQSLTTGSISG